MGNTTSKKEEVKVVIVDPNATVVVKQAKTTPNAVRVVETRPNNQVTVEKVEVTQKPFNFRTVVESITESLLGIGPWIHRQKVQFGHNEVSNSYRDFKAYLCSEVKEPLCKLYNTIPEKFTDAKFQLIDPYTYNQRFTTLNILCALTAIGTIGSTPKVDPFSRLLRTTRNVAFMYIFGGLILAPEIYNPFLRTY